MRVVQQLPFGVPQCAVLPQRKSDPEGFIHVTTPPPPGKQQFISAEAIRVMGNEFGMVSKMEAKNLRFENHRLERELQEAREELARNDRLESDLAEARETISESEEVIALFTSLMEEGYDPQKIKGLRKRITGVTDAFADLDQTVAELEDALSRAKNLVKAREKVAA